MKPIGVLALQGDFHAHRVALGEAGAETVEVRRPSELEEISGLVIPGGESTTLVKLVHDMGFAPPLRALPSRGVPVLGTCAGAILLSRRVEGSDQFCLRMIDADVRRNAYGRQRESFESSRGALCLEGQQTAGREISMVFIRAPRFGRIGPKVQVLATHGGEPVLIREDAVLAATFHPEMGSDRTIQRIFLGLAARAMAPA